MKNVLVAFICFMASAAVSAQPNGARALDRQRQSELMKFVDGKMDGFEQSDSSDYARFLRLLRASSLRRGQSEGDAEFLRAMKFISGLECSSEVCEISSPATVANIMNQRFTGDAVDDSIVESAGRLIEDRIMFCSAKGCEIRDRRLIRKLNEMGPIMPFTWVGFEGGGGRN